MTTFKFRFRFKVAYKGTITGEENEFEFMLPSGHITTIRSIDNTSFSQATQFVVSSGGYTSEFQALESGFKLKNSVLFYAVKYRAGIDVGQEKESGSFSQYVKDKIFKEQGIKLLSDVHGITVCSEAHPTAFASASFVAVVGARNANFFSNEICSLLSNNVNVTDQHRLAMELMTSSFFESTTRARFLTLILAAESILSPDYRSEEVRSLIDEFKDLTNRSGIRKQEQDSIIGALNWLYKDSISKSLKKMANKYLPNTIYDGLSSEKFITKCYNARSKLVHSGKVKNEDYDIDALAANLELYMRDILTEITSL